MLELITGILIMIALGYVGFIVQDYLVESTLNDLVEDEEDSIFEIDMEHVVMYSNRSNANDVSELKKKLQDFKNRNKFYKM
ncbi:hypothetical protein PXC01_01800 [Maribacter sp. M208]|uniref:hypothetical protein n=1 Tax=Maribacter huludaoensis TaxID=3030010 RepID=UPI0023EDA433|nr:hypothetical protein [Maribacter huludaoensis]MDF4220300.1 hypothetical protein [Maribacter huludaoensis]